MPLLQANYELRIYSPTDGTLQTIITPTEFTSMYLERTLNSYDTMTLYIDEDSPHVQYFVTDAIIEVRRRLARTNSTWYVESTLFHRTPDRRFTTNQKRQFISYSRGLNDLLHRRFILYPANTSFTLKDGPGETVMKAFVEENAGPSATSAFRKSTLWTAPIFGLSVQSDGAHGVTWKGARTWQNVLDVLNEISVVAGVDFDVVRTGPRTFEFRTYYPQYGQDLSASVLFSTGFANMTNVVFVQSRTEEVNAVVVLGPGQESSRITWPAVDAGATVDSPWNTIETVQDARAQPSVAEMETTAQQVLDEGRAQDDFSFTVLQTAIRQYGPVGEGEYWFGDIVRAQYGAVNVLRKIVGVTINLNQGNEDLQFSFSEYPSTPV